jgi:hypothetical protein
MAKPIAVLNDSRLVRGGVAWYQLLRIFKTEGPGHSPTLGWEFQIFEKLEAYKLDFPSVFPHKRDHTSKLKLKQGTFRASLEKPRSCHSLSQLLASLPLITPSFQLENR